MVEVLGTLFVNEVACPVTEVSFHDGQVFVHAESPSFTLSDGETEVRLHGRDGSLIFVERVPWPATKIRSTDRVTLLVPLKMDSSILGEPWAKAWNDV